MASLVNCTRVAACPTGAVSVKRPPASEVTAARPAGVTTTPASGCPPFVATSDPLSVAVVGAGDGVTGVPPDAPAVPGEESPHATAITIRTAANARM